METNDWLILICSISGVFIGMSLRTWQVRMKRHILTRDKNDP